MVVKAKKSTVYKTNLQKVKEDLASIGGDEKWYKPRPGKNYIRVLPPWGESANGKFYLSGALHYGFKIGGRDKAIACRNFSNKGICPICLLVEKLKASGDDDYKKVIDRIRIKPKYWVNMIDVKNPGSGVKMYGGSKKFIKLLLESCDDEDYGDVTDPEEGYDVVIIKEGEGMQTRYTERLRPKPTPISKEAEGWEDQLHQLDSEVLEWISIPDTWKYLKDNFGDLMAEMGIKAPKNTKGDDDEDEKQTKPGKNSKVGKKKAKDEDEDEEEDDDESSETEDDDEDEEDD